MSDLPPEITLKAIIMAKNVDITQTKVGQETAIAPNSPLKDNERCDAQSTKKGADVWKYFDRQKDIGTAVCKSCKAVLKATGGCTSGLISHAKSQHDINILKRKVIAG